MSAECLWLNRKTALALLSWMAFAGFLLMPRPVFSLPATDDFMSGWTVRFAPPGPLYPRYVADPLSPASAMTTVHYSDSGIPEAGDKRHVFRIGGRMGIFRVSPQDNPGAGLQFNLHAAFLGMFDRTQSLDNIGWDGLYGIDTTLGLPSGMAFKLGISHDSSHVGDEYAERIGRRRINYTRQEYVLGASFPAGEHVRAYGEAGWAFDLRNEEIQDKRRLQAGVELEDRSALWRGRIGYYGAVDITSFEESEWEPDVTVQCGLLLPAPQSPRTLRVGLEYRDGRSVIGEFSVHEEAYWAVGIWIDL